MAVSETEAASALQGWVFNIQRFSIHDGPGIRTTVFLKGCPLRCEWCHNPEGLEARTQLRLSPTLCSHCGRCMAVCEHGGHVVTPEAHRLEPERCVACGQCVEVCPGGALELVGRRMTVEQVMAVVRRDVPFYEQSGGGMTLSGGEPLAQADFARSLLEAARREGMHTATETSAFGSWKRLEALLPLVNLWLVDIKHTDDARHRELTGVSNASILANIRALVERGADLVLRVPWVPCRNAEESFLEGLIAFMGGLARIPPVEIMPYHRLGLGKWESLGRAPTMPPDIPAATPADVEPWIERLHSAGIRAEVT